jgi:hypothetical protein
VRVPDFLGRLYARNADVLGWKWVPDDHIVDNAGNPLSPEPPFQTRQDYVVLRLSEMYLRTIRRLWREYYPVTHAFVAYGDPAAQREVAMVAGPGQLKDLGSENLDRLIGLAYRLAGPLVYDGQDIEILAGLYAVPAKDGAALLIDTLSQISGLVPALAEATKVAGVLKNGVDGLLGLSGTELKLAVRDSLRPPGAGAGRVAKPGFLVGFNAPAGSIDASQLWIKDGRLFIGANPIAARAFDVTDAMVFELHRGQTRTPGWATLPKLAEHAVQFEAALKNTGAGDLAKRINELYQAFEFDVDASIELTDPDKAAIRSIAADELRRRVGKIRGGGIIETKGFGELRPVDPRTFRPSDFAELPAGLPLPSRPAGLPVVQ